MTENHVWRSVDHYLNEQLIHQDDALHEAVQATIDADMPQIQVAPNQGRQLMLLAMAMQARSVLEIGTLGGFSTIWLARAIPAAPAGRLLTLEINPRHAEVARHNIDRAGVGDRVEIRVGPAIDALPVLAAEQAREGRPAFDLIFVDADKENAVAYFDWSVRLARPGGVIIVDNVIRRGELLEADHADERVRAVRALMGAVGRDDRVLATAVQTVGEKGHDGYLMAVKKPD